MNHRRERGERRETRKGSRARVKEAVWSYREVFAPVAGGLRNSVLFAERLSFEDPEARVFALPRVLGQLGLEAQVGQGLL